MSNYCKRCGMLINDQLCNNCYDEFVNQRYGPAKPEPQASVNTLLRDVLALEKFGWGKEALTWGSRSDGEYIKIEELLELIDEHFA